MSDDQRSDRDQSNQSQTNLGLLGHFINSTFCRSLVCLRKTSKGPDYEGWTRNGMTPDEIRAHAAAGRTEAGLLCRDYPAIDIDCDDPTIYNIIIQGAKGVLLALNRARGGHAIKRGRDGSPRIALVYRRRKGHAPWAKRVYHFEPTDPASGLSPFKIETLGDGQQVKLAGTHPDTGGRYRPEIGGVRLADDPVAFMEAAKTLTEISAAEIGDVVDCMVRAIETDGRYRLVNTYETRSRGDGDGRRVPLGSNSLMLGARGLVEELVRLIGVNTAEKFPDHMDAVAVCAAIAGASGGAEWGRELWTKWALEESEYPNSRSWCDLRWASFEREGTSSGIDRLVELAEIHGGREAAALARKWRGNRVRRTGAFTAVRDDTTEDPTKAEGSAALAPITASQALRLIRKGDGAHLVANRLVSRRGWARPEARPSRITKPAEFFDRFVYVQADKMFFDRVTGEHLANNDTLQAALASHPIARHPALAKTNAKGEEVGYHRIWPWALDQREIVSVTRRDYWPGQPEFYVGEKGEAVWNTWRPHPALPKALADAEALGPGAPPLVRDDEVRWFLDVVDHLIDDCDEQVPDAVIRERFLDWGAFGVGYPELKPGHHFLISSNTQGVGKSTLAELLMAVLGPDNSRAAEAGDIGGEWGYHLTTKLVAVEELIDIGTQREARQKYNKVKTFLSPYPSKVPVNQKNLAVIYVPNVTMWIMFSNHDAEALAIDNNERRLVILILSCGRLPAHISKAARAALKDPAKIELLVRWFADRAVRELPKMVPHPDGPEFGEITRFDLVSGNAWNTLAKDETREASGGAIAQWITGEIKAGRWPKVTTSAAVLEHMREHPLWAAKATQLTPNLVARGMREAGLVYLNKGAQGRAEPRAGAPRVRFWGTAATNREFDPKDPRTGRRIASEYRGEGGRFGRPGGDPKDDFEEV